MKTQTKLAFLTFCCLSFGLFAKPKEESAHVAIHGVNKEIEENIRANLSILHETVDEDTTLSDLEQRSKHEISSALQPYGYYDAKVQTSLVLQDGKVNASISIQLGEPVHISGIHFNIIGEGEHDPKLSGLLMLLQLKIGDILVHDAYEQGKKAILAQVIQNGYLNATFTEHKVEVDIETKSSQIYLTLFTGPRHYFGDITYENTVLSPMFLDRYLPFHRNDPYSPEKIMLLQNRLAQSDYFKTTNVKAITNENSSVVPVVVELEDAKPNHYILGAGYGTDTGARAKLGWTRRRLNSMGHRFSAQAQISEIYDKLYVDYSIPGKHPYTDQLKFQGGYYDDEYSEKPSQIYETGILEERTISNWQRKLGINYHHERFNAFITNDVVESRLILPSVTFIQVKKSPSDAVSGRRIEFSMRGSVDALISDVSFFQTYLQLKWVHGFSEATRLLIRGDLGATLPDDSERLPLSQRFFAGGDLSLRGYGYRSLPAEIDKDGNYQPVGGAYLAVGSVELVHTVKKPFGVFTFVDAGNAYRKLFQETAIGVGVGVEWQTKLGPVKFAIAKPLTKTSDAWRIHATFGPELS